MTDLKEGVRRALGRVLVGSGVTALGRRVVDRRGTIIFMGHRVAETSEDYLEVVRPSHFDAQVAYLARHYEIIPLETLLDCFEKKAPVPSRSVVLTFDDGFRDNLENALPVLEKHRAPATVFVVTGSVTSGDLPWSQRLGFMFEQTRRQELPSIHVGREMDLTSAAARRRGYDECKKRVRRLARRDRERILEALAADLGVEPPRDRMLTWANVREMRQRGVGIGAHTVSHPLLEFVPPDEAREELEQSKEDLRREVGLEAVPFAFPGGSSTPELVELVRKMGFRSAFQSTSRRRLNSPATTSPYALSRIGLPSGPAYLLEAELEGPYHALRSLYRRGGGR